MIRRLSTSFRGIIIFFADHNGNYTVAYKNISFWVSRTDLQTWQNKPTPLLATSPGGRGAISVLELARNEFPRRGANVVGSFLMPNFYSNFSDEEGIIDETVKYELNEKISLFLKQLS